MASPGLRIGAFCFGVAYRFIFKMKKRTYKDRGLICQNFTQRRRRDATLAQRVSAGVYAL
jgi:hypothetical protein